VHDDLSDLLLEWLPRQRWYAGKGRELTSVRITASVELDVPPTHSETADGGQARVLQTLVEVQHADSGAHEEPDIYQVPLVLRSRAPEGWHAFHVGDLPDGPVYDGLHDPIGNAALLAALASEFGTTGWQATAVGPLSVLPGKTVGVEQSNTSVIYGDAYILKVFRRLAAGENPDLELTRALADAGSRHIAAPLGWVTGTLPHAPGTPTTFALLQEFLRSGTDGWKLAQASVRDLYAEADLYPEEVGGDFAGESERLGEATAEVHALLARSLQTRTAGADSHHETADQMHRRLEVAMLAAPELEPFAAAVHASYDEVATLFEPVPVQRIHGDYHLGQVMRIDSGWVLLDFEGEPARPLAERTVLMSPLRDVAGMLRSFDYAARSLLADRQASPTLNARAQEWVERNRAAFCAGYESGGGRDPREQAVLLRAFELDKAVYEVVYEARHRPGWLSIPLGAVARLAD
jgi:maltokinase